MSVLQFPEVVGPCVHLNGTSKGHLLENLNAVYDLLEQAREALKQAAPNGRDYYIGNVTLDQATEQHRARMLAIDAIQKSLMGELELIADQD